MAKKFLFLACCWLPCTLCGQQGNYFRLKYKLHPSDLRQITLQRLVTGASPINMTLVGPVKVFITVSQGMIYADFWQITNDNAAVIGSPTILNSMTPDTAQGFVITDNRRRVGDPTIKF